MAELVEKLGLDWKLLLAQIFNFLILMWILKRYAYGPILKALEQRRQKIQQGLEDAKQAQLELSVIEQEKARILQAAHAEANTIAERARQEAMTYADRSRQTAKGEAAALVAAAKREAERAKEQVVVEAQAELADLVAASTEKLIRVKLDGPADRKLIDAMITAAKEPHG